MFDKITPQKQRCEDCEYCRIIDGGGWSFYGCYCEPYRGKWVAEIKDCPKKELGGDSDEKRKSV